MTVRSGAALCTGCHAPRSAGMAAKHTGMDLTAVRCSSCHDPHVQAKTAKGLLRPVPHAPSLAASASRATPDGGARA